MAKVWLQVEVEEKAKDLLRVQAAKDKVPMNKVVEQLITRYGNEEVSYKQEAAA